MLKITLLSFLIINLVKCSVGMNPECNTNILKDRETLEIMDSGQLCKDKPCLIWYCPEKNTVLFKYNNTLECTSIEEISKITNVAIDFPELEVYKVNDDISMLEKSEKQFSKDFHHVTYNDRIMYSKNCSQKWTKFTSTKYYVLREDGSSVRVDRQMTSDILIDKGSFAIKYQFENKGGNWTMTKWIKFLNSKLEDGHHIYNAIGMGISTFFLIFVLVIYSILPKLQNLSGLMLMAKVASLTVGFGVKAALLTIQLSNKGNEMICQIMSPTWYYGVLACFFWMNAMSFDVYRSFRNMNKAKNRSNPHKRQMRKFYKYCAYAFGVPLLIVMSAVIIDTVEIPSDYVIRKPSFNSCFPTESNIMYIYIPIIVLLLCNLLLVILTSVNIYLAQKSVMKYLKSSNSGNTKKEKARFIIYVKLTLVLGLTWLLDLVELAGKVPPWLSYILNCNVFIGLAIFVINICRREVLVPLSQKLSCGRRFTKRWASKYSENQSSTRTDRKLSATNSVSESLSSCSSPGVDNPVRSFP